MNKEYKTFEKLKEELGDKFEEFMYKSNIELLDEVNRLETIINEAIHNIKYKENIIKSFPNSIRGIDFSDLLSILERGKE